MGDGINTFAGASSQQWAEAFEKAGRVRSFVLTKEIPVTPEMITAGMSALRRPCSPDYELVQGVFRAMAALARPDTLAQWNTLVRNDLIDREASALKERDEAHAEVRQCHGDIAFLNDVTERQAHVLGGACNREAAQSEMIDRLTDSNCSLSATNERLRDEIAALTAEKNALHDIIAQSDGQPAQGGQGDPNAPAPPNPATPPATKGQVPGPPGHNPFRDHGGDHRRIGG